MAVGGQCGGLACAPSGARHSEPRSTQPQRSPLAAQEPVAPTGTGAPAPTPTPTPLQLDIGRHVSALLARHGTSGLPRFEETIEVVARGQPALDDLLRGRDLACGPTSSGPPLVSDLNDYRGATIPVHGDLLALGRLAWSGISRLRHPMAKWFLYRVQREGAPRFVLREGEVSAAERYAAIGTIWEEMARFHDRGRAVDAQRRLERGFATAERQTSDDKLPPWVATTCRPPGLH